MTVDQLQQSISIEAEQYDIVWQKTISSSEHKITGFAKWNNQTIGVELPAESINIILPNATLRLYGSRQRVEKARDPFGFSEKRFYLSHQAATKLTAEKVLSINQPSHSFVAALENQRQKMIHHIMKTYPNVLQKDALSLLLGNDELVDDEWRSVYQTLGISHLFAISGLHIVLFLTMFYFFLKRFNVRLELIQYFIVLLLPIYACIAGGAPSVWRATICALLVIGIRFFRIRIDSTSLLSICFLLFVFWQPTILFQIGFQLSFLATFTIIVSLSILRNITSTVGQLLFISTITQISLTPLLLWHFYEISWTSMLYNLVYVPLFSYILLPLHLILFFLSFLSKTLFQIFTIPLLPLYKVINHSEILFANIPNQLWNPGKPSILIFSIVSGLSFVLFLLIERRKWRAVGLTSFVCFGLLQMSPILHTSLRVSVIDVGQGESVLIEGPFNQFVYLIDTGGRSPYLKNSTFEIGKNIVLPHLKGRGIKRIDGLILTHADSDHMEGADEIIGHRKIDSIHISPNSWKDDMMKGVIKQAKKEQIPIQEVGNGLEWRVGDATFAYVSPSDTVYEGNNDSLVVLITYGENRLLFTGDLEKEGENDLLRFAPEKIHDVTLLKIGHHGSKTSTSASFLTWTNPKMAVISSGRHNPYGHPHKEVVMRLKELHIPVWNTQNEGTVQLEFWKNGRILKNSD